ncbi:phage tail tape measure protein [Carboxylicivirga marina]|uniref:Phage tail tape measure protein n=1 Tax=Carboxylicivirga marina TaxID=2800988 RepID=A0ABS1HGB6_9BACT|nr:phage tail tape measure protein [Carboxylicivirga marina]MBK3516711.1 phage tail tape measure protein [Carboxylicivirga marina]
MAGTIESRIALRGDISDVMKKMSTYQRKVYGVNKKVNKSFSNTNRVVGQLGGVLAGLGVGMGLKKILDVSGDFQNSMARVKAITQATDEDFKKLSNTAKQLGSTTQFSASQAAEGLQYLGMAGYNTEQSIAALPSTLNLAAAGAIELGQAADIASNVVAGMGYDISETERVIDVLAHTSRTANTNVTEMGEAAKKAAPVFGGLNLEVEELALSAAILANNGIKGADAGTAMAGSLSRLLKQPKMVAQALDELGVTINETSIKNDGFIGTLERLRDAGINNTQMAQIFGDHWKSIGTIINTSESELTRLTKAIGNSQGAAESMAKDGVGVWQKGMNQLNSAIEGLMIRLGEGGLLGFVTQLVSNITYFVGVLSNMTGSFENAIPVIYGAATAITALYAAMTGGLSAITTAIAVGAVGIVAYWNDIIRAIENGINAVIDFINQSDTLRTVFIAVSENIKFFWVSVKTYFGLAIDYIQTAGEFIYRIFEGIWLKVKSLFTDDDYSFIDGITTEFKEAFNEIKEAGKKASDILNNQFQTAVKKIKDAYDGKEIAHVKLNLTTTTGSKGKEVNGNVGQAKPAIESFGEDFEFEELNEGLDIVDSKIINMNEELQSLGNSFSTVFGGASDSLGSFIGKALSSTPKLIENLQKLGLVQKQQAIQEVAQNQAKAMSGGAASGAKLPFPANIAAIAAVLATVTSVFASLPKFEDGGVVGGNSYYGDKILARVNSKELILNRQQQASLYNQMNSGLEGSFQIGEARVRGGDIIYAIEYTSKNRKRNG